MSPSASRSRAPPRRGTATINPFCASERPNSGTIEFASAPGKSQIMKLTSKYKNALSKVGAWPARRKSRRFIPFEAPVFEKWPQRTLLADASG